MPLAAQSRDEPEPYSLPASTTSGTPSAGVALGGLVDGGLLAVGQVQGDPALGARGQLVAQPDVGEGAPHHDLVVAPSGPVGVEVGPLDAVVGQVAAGRAWWARCCRRGRCGRW